MRFLEFKVAGLVMVLLMVATFSFSDGAIEHQVNPNMVAGRWVSETAESGRFVVIDVRSDGSFRRGIAETVRAKANYVIGGTWTLEQRHKLTYQTKTVWFYDVVFQEKNAPDEVMQVRSDGTLCTLRLPLWCFSAVFGNWES